MKKKLSIFCQLPTSIMFVDDNQGFLHRTIGAIGYDVSTHMFTEPQVAINYLNDNPSLLKQTIATCSENIDPTTVDSARELHNVIDVRLTPLFQHLYQPKRFNEITVVVVDYSMPMMNGLVFCERIKENPAKKIMLTGEADHGIAVNAFNQHLIDQFIPKQELESNEDKTNHRITALAHDLQQDYFATLCSFLNKELLAHPSHLAFSNDIIFQRFFNELIQRLNIVEYYLLDEVGSYVLLDEQGTINWLFVSNDTLFSNYLHIAKDNEASKAIIAKLEKKSHLPFFLTDDDLDASIIQWDNYLYPAEKLQGEQTYYYTVVENDSLHYIDKNRVVSYRQFLRENA
ncbi:MAG: response regulator [Gammaproteobacteria bacterium]|nr:response regulator [Gammaproteobacteria bacterium]